MKIASTKRENYELKTCKSCKGKTFFLFSLWRYKLCTQLKVPLFKILNIQRISFQLLNRNLKAESRITSLRLSIHFVKGIFKAPLMTYFSLPALLSNAFIIAQWSFNLNNQGPKTAGHFLFQASPHASALASAPYILSSSTALPFPYVKNIFTTVKTAISIWLLLSWKLAIQNIEIHNMI